MVLGTSENFKEVTGRRTVGWGGGGVVFFLPNFPLFTTSGRAKCRMLRENARKWREAGVSSRGKEMPTIKVSPNSKIVKQIRAIYTKLHTFNTPRERQVSPLFFKKKKNLIPKPL